MQDKDMLSILKSLDSVGKKPLTESAIAECGPMSAPASTTPVTVNLSAGSAEEMAMILRALSGIGQGSEVHTTGLMASPIDDPDIPGRDDVAGDDDMKDGVLGGLAGAGLGYMAGGVPGAIAGGYLGHKTQQAADRDESVEEWDNEPDEEYSDHKTMTKTLSGGINRQKQMFKPAAKGDNPMAAESIKERLLKALAEAKKSKPDFLDMDKDGNKKEPMKKAVKDKKKNPFAKTNEAKKSKPDFLDMDKDGNKKEPMKKAVADKKKKAPVKEGAAPYAPVYLQHLKQQFGDKQALSRSDKYKIADIIKKSSIEHLKQLVTANIPHVSQAAKYYLRHNTPGGMVSSEAEVQAPNHELSDLSRKTSSIAQIIKRKINSGEQMDDRDYNQMAELGAVLSRVGSSFGPKSMKDVMSHMVQYTNDRNEEGHGYPEFNVDRFKQLIAMAKSTGESAVSEISPALAKRYTKAAKMDRDFNDDDIARLSKSGQSTQAMHRRNSKRTKGINLAKKRM